MRKFAETALFIVFMLAVSANVQYSTGGSTFKEFYDQADKLDVANRDDEAADMYSKAIDTWTTNESFDDLVACYYYRAQVYLRTDRYPQARADIDKALELAPDDGYNVDLLSAYLNQTGDYRAALTNSRRALELLGNNDVAYKNLGWAYLGLGIYEDAVKAFSQAIGLRADYAEAYCRRGVCYIGLGQYDTAVSDLSNALRVNPDYFDAVFLRGEAYYIKGEWNDALRDLDHALALEPGSVSAEFLRAMTYEALGDRSSASNDMNALTNDEGSAVPAILQLVRADALSGVTNTDPDFTLNYLAGIRLLDSKVYDRAAYYFTRAIDLASNENTVYARRAEAYTAMGLDQLARADRIAAGIDTRTVSARAGTDTNTAPAETTASAEETIRTNGQTSAAAAAVITPSESVSQNPQRMVSLRFEGVTAFERTEADKYYNRSINYLWDGKYAAAVQNISAAIRLNPYEAKYYNIRGFAYYMKDDLTDAETDFGQAIRLKPDFAYPYCNRAFVHYARGEYEQAIADATLALQYEPKYSKALFVRAESYLGLGRNDTALVDVNAAIGVNANWGMNAGLAEGYNLRGMIYNLRGDYDQAFEQFKKAVAIDPRSAKAYRNMGIVYYFRKEYEKSVEAYTKALRLDRNDYLAYYNRGISYCAMQKFDLGVLDFNRAISLAPYYSRAYRSRGIAYYRQGLLFLASEDLKKAAQLGDGQSASLLISLFHGRF